ncbi:general substrate transporter [Morchella snyderi]|nr:general substrate transporter [Morchella snyderi]
MSVSVSSSTHKTRLQVALENKRVIAYCLYVSLAAITYGFDGAVSGYLLSLPVFVQHFGYNYNGTFVVPAIHQSTWNGVVVAGGVLGAFVAGPIGNHLGRRYLFIIGSVISACGILAQELADEWRVMAAGKFINYIAMSMYAVGAPTYISEICPVELRGIALTFFNFFTLIGQFICSCVMQGTMKRSDALSFRIPIIVQYGVPLILFVGTWFIPETPYWHAERGQNDAAKASLEKLHGGKVDFEERFRDIQSEIEHNQKASTVKFLDCFKGSNLRRTFIAAGVLSGQQLVGVSFVFGYTTYFFILSGIATAQAFTITAIMFALQVVANMCSWYSIDRFGRRFLLLVGTSIMFVSLYIIGGVGTNPLYTTGHFPKVVVSFMVIFSVFYQLSLGSVGWTVASEVSSSVNRASTQAIAVFWSTIFGFAISFSIPYLINPDEANLGPKVGFIYGSFTLIVLAFIWFCVPEMKGRSYEELDYMFRNGIPTRAFENFKVPAGEIMEIGSAQLSNEKHRASPDVAEVAV